jgi:hypothetical protein
MAICSLCDGSYSPSAAVDVLTPPLDTCRQGRGGSVIIVEMMVFGNMNSNSGSGIIFTRDPQTGENNFAGRLEKLQI